MVSNWPADFSAQRSPVRTWVTPRTSRGNATSWLNRSAQYRVTVRSIPMQKVELNMTASQPLARRCSTSRIFGIDKRIVLETSKFIGVFNGQVYMDQRHGCGRGCRAIGAPARARHPDALCAEWAAVGGGGGVAQ